MDDRIRNIAIEIQGYTWNARLFGTGNRYLLVFHGYGQEATAFSHLGELLEGSYTLVMMDLAYHGANSTMQADFLFTPEYAVECVEQLCSALNVDRINLAGYSIGARVAMSISCIIPARIDELWLFAPDGMPVSAFYKFLTSSAIGISLFRGFVKRPHVVFGLIKLGKGLRLIKPKAAKFYMHEIADLEKRQQLFNTWMAYRLAIPNHSVLHDAQLSVLCVLGIDDSIIPFSKTRRFIKKKLSRAQLYELEAGHNILSDKAIRKFSEHWETKSKKRHRAALEE